MAKIKLGDAVRDRISGFEGEVCAITDWLNGCRRICIAPSSLDKDGKLMPNETFDVQQVVLIKAAATEERSERLRPLEVIGGPAIAATRAPDPT